MTLFHGRVSTVDMVGRTSATLTVASDLVVLDYDMPRNLYSPTCLHTLYDAGLRRRRAEPMRRTAPSAPARPRARSTSPARWLSHAQGSLVFTSGVNANVRATVKSVAPGAALTLIYPLPAAPAAGDAFTVYAGCDHTPRDLPARFSNLANFRGFPFVPPPQIGVLTMIADQYPVSGAGVPARVAPARDPAGAEARPTVSHFTVANELIARARVVAAAREWIGTPYHHMADVKGVGCDCAMLLVRVFCDLGLVEPFDPRPYTRDWHLHRGEERYLGLLLERAHAVATPQAGDVILFQIRPLLRHGGIVARADPLTIVHAFAPARRVLEEEIVAQRRIVRAPRRGALRQLLGLERDELVPTEEGDRRRPGLHRPATANVGQHRCPSRSSGGRPKPPPT